MWLCFSGSNATQTGASQVPEMGQWLHGSPPVHLIAYMQSIWPAPVRRAYKLAGRLFPDLRVEDILQVFGLFQETGSLAF